MAGLDIWCLRRHLRELTALLGPRPTVLRTCEMAPGDWGLVLRTASGARGLLRLRGQPQNAGVVWLPTWDEPAVDPSVFGASLDRRLHDSRVISMSVPGWDRVVVFDLARQDSVLGGITRCRLVLELTGRITNALIVDDDGVVVDQWNHHTQNGIRKEYVSPPVPSDRLDPLAATAEQIAVVLRAPPEVWGDRIHGLHPKLARELAFRLGVNPVDPGQVYKTMTAELQAELPVRVVVAGDRVVAISVLPLGHLGHDSRDFATVNDALLWIDRDLQGGRDLASLRQRASQRWRKELDRVEAGLADEQRRLVSYQNADANKRAGELILAYLHQIAPRMSSVELPGFDDGVPVVVELDPRRSPPDNAAAYFHRYKKAKRGLAASQRRLETLRGEAGWLREQVFLCEQADRASDLEAMIRSESSRKSQRSRPASSTAASGERKQAKALKPLVELDGCRFYVGRNARHNDLITFHVGRRGDIWLHAHEVPGSHVLVRRPGSTPTDDDVHRGAVLAAWFSAARQGGNVVVDATDVGTVKRIPGGGPGRVSFRPQQSMRVNPSEAAVLLASGVFADE